MELLTRQLSDFQGEHNAAANADKQRKIAEQQRSEQARLAAGQEKLAHDKAEFAKHLAIFKEQRKEVLGGNVVATVGGGVPKARYKKLRAKRDKYKRKDYRKGKDVNTMQKRLLLNVELVEVEDSQTSEDSSSATVQQRSDASASLSAAPADAADVSASASQHESVQLVHDTSSEADSLEA